METQKRLAQISGPKYPDGHTGKAIGKLQQNQFLNSLSIALKRSSSYLEVHICFFRKGAEYELLHHEISETLPEVIEKLEQWDYIWCFDDHQQIYRSTGLLQFTCVHSATDSWIPMCARHSVGLWGYNEEQDFLPRTLFHSPVWLTFSATIDHFLFYSLALLWFQGHSTVLFSFLISPTFLLQPQ